MRVCSLIRGAYPVPAQMLGRTFLEDARACMMCGSGQDSAATAHAQLAALPLPGGCKMHHEPCCAGLAAGWALHLLLGGLGADPHTHVVGWAVSRVPMMQGGCHTRPGHMTGAAVCTPPPMQHRSAGTLADAAQPDTVCTQPGGSRWSFVLVPVLHVCAPGCSYKSSVLQASRLPAGTHMPHT